ncbi:hypothetical protein [Thauera sp.]|nr:hypothetical protein [Thauera sp.]
MKRVFLASAFVLATGTAQADVGAFVGITYAFGSNQGIGFTVQATSTRKQDRGILAAGLSYHPFATGSKVGLPVGVGYQWKDAAAIVGYDVLLKSPVVSGGYVDTRSKRRSAAPSGEGSGGEGSGGEGSGGPV